MTAATLSRALEQKRAVEQVGNSDTAPAIMKLDLAKKYEALYEATIVQHQTQSNTAQTSAPALPIKV